MHSRSLSLVALGRWLLFTAAVAFGAFLLAWWLSPALTAQSLCTTPQPGPSWLCVGGGWLPPNHPRYPIVTAPPLLPVLPTQTGLRVGRRYERGGVELYVLGLAQTYQHAVTVYVAECLTTGEGCAFVGQGRLLVATSDADGWRELPEGEPR